MKHIHQLQIFFNYFYFSFNTKHFTLKLGRGRVVQLLISEKIFKLGKQTLIFLLANCISLSDMVKNILQDTQRECECK